MKKKVDSDLEVGSEGFVEEFLVKPTFDDDGVQASAAIGVDGKEYGDPVPMAPPVGFDAPPDLREMMREMIHNEAYQRRLDEAGFDTEEEAADFDIDDDPLPPLTFHEAVMMPPAGPPASSPPSSAAPQVTAEKEGGEGGDAAKPVAPADPSAAPPVRST